MKAERAKKVVTKDHEGNTNGWLLELAKAGKKTKTYLSASEPRAFKGYHLHRVREANYVCIKGSIKIILYQHDGNRWQRSEYIMDAATPTRLTIPVNVATGLETLGNEEAWIVNHPNPAYDPDLQDEQVEYTQEELETGVQK